MRSSPANLGTQKIFLGNRIDGERSTNVGSEETTACFDNPLQNHRRIPWLGSLYQLFQNRLIS